MRSRGLVLQCLEAMSSTDEKTLRFAMDDFLDNFGKDVEIGQASRRKLLQRYARVFSRLQNVRSTKRFPELHAAMATAAGEHSSPGFFVPTKVPTLTRNIGLFYVIHNHGRR